MADGSIQVVKLAVSGFGSGLSGCLEMAAEELEKKDGTFKD
jgi:hypothetical protein